MKEPVYSDWNSLRYLYKLFCVKVEGIFNLSVFLRAYNSVSLIFYVFIDELISEHWFLRSKTHWKHPAL